MSINTPTIKDPHEALNSLAKLRAGEIKGFWITGDIAFSWTGRGSGQRGNSGILDNSSTIMANTYIAKDIAGRVCVAAVTDKRSAYKPDKD